MPVMLVNMIYCWNRGCYLLAVAEIPEVMLDASRKWAGNFGREMPRARGTRTGIGRYFLDSRTTAGGQVQLNRFAIDVILLAIAEYRETDRIVAGAAIDMLRGCYAAGRESSDNGVASVSKVPQASRDSGAVDVSLERNVPTIGSGHTSA
jgi:hypothetical protein